MMKPGEMRPSGAKFAQAAAFLGVIGAWMSVRVVPPASVGVVAVFGAVRQDMLNSGMHFCHPLSEVHLYQTKTQLLDQQNHVPTAEGLTVDLDVSILFHIEQNEARNIFINLGLGYIDIVIKPELASAVRGLTSEVEAKALYTSDRSVIQSKLSAELSKVLQPRGIVVEDVLLKAVKLPEQLTHSIELKAQAEQESARMEFVLSKERQEATRKSVEARGISDFQKIVSEGISPALLQWKGIEATENLAKSQNSKIVMVGNTAGSLPVILGGDAATAKAPATQR
jgi:regulator of protease activity HflC (stomatin/prohibitin superfamily)